MPNWAFCIVDTSYKSALRYVTLVDDRTSNTLLRIFSEVIVTASTVFSGEWREYLAFSNSSDFEDKTVCYKYNFVSPVDGTHTQNVESYNNRLKLKV